MNSPPHVHHPKTPSLDCADGDDDGNEHADDYADNIDDDDNDKVVGHRKMLEYLISLGLRLGPRCMHESTPRKVIC